MNEIAIDDSTVQFAAGNGHTGYIRFRQTIAQPSIRAQFLANLGYHASLPNPVSGAEAVTSFLLG